MFAKIYCVSFLNIFILMNAANILIELNEERCYLDVEDTVFVVGAVYKTKLPDGGRDQIDVL